MVSFIVKTCNGREEYAAYLNDRIPDLIVSYDRFTDSGINDKAYQNFQQALLMAGDGATVQMEDDIILCDNFYAKCIKEIEKRPDDVIQFFSMRRDDLTIGSRYEPGSKYMMMQCTYLPKGLAKELHEFSLSFNTERRERNSPTDVCVSHFLKSRKMRYWLVIPNLVDHRIGVSAIDKKRSSKRVSLTFKI